MNAIVLKIDPSKGNFRLGKNKKKAGDTMFMVGVIVLLSLLMIRTWLVTGIIIDSKLDVVATRTMV
jgi:hypothetical protein